MRVLVATGSLLAGLVLATPVLAAPMSFAGQTSLSSFYPMPSGLSVTASPMDFSALLDQGESTGYLIGSHIHLVQSVQGVMVGWMFQLNYTWSDGTRISFGGWLNGIENTARWGNEGALLWFGNPAVLDPGLPPLVHQQVILTNGTIADVRVYEQLTPLADAQNTLGVENFDVGMKIQYVGDLPAATQVPEPMSAMLLGTGMFGLGVWRHARRRGTNCWKWLP
jgi:hypothetical protein